MILESLPHCSITSLSELGTSLELRNVFLWVKRPGGVFPIKLGRFPFIRFLYVDVCSTVYIYVLNDTATCILCVYCTSGHYSFL